MRRCLRSSFRLLSTCRYTLLVQTVLIVTLIAASALMTEKRFTLQQALTVYHRLKQRATEAVRSNSRMAWRCSGNSNEELVRNLEKGQIFSSSRVRDAMLAVDRADFSPISPYRDQPQGIGWNATISAPHMHAAALEYLKNHLVEGAYALDVGSGSGYLTVCMAIMIGSTGKVVGIEHIPELVDLAKENTRKNHSDLLDSGRVVFVEGDGRKGYPMERKFDAIHVGAAAETIPNALIEQLAEGGRMLIPVGKERGNQVFLQVDKANGSVTQKVIEHVIYVPLTSKAHQLGRYE
ncbi:protein-L-isoaspartate O-methyltransferase [Dictyocaulus viviparus]|uniref:Protein-L-isoaspartate(D-aspartate) O-methyltransferase n=1 Tax=Dictyocaulus viviparus TaxID=29172 RepID=A0A0D8YG14_DICVI|nr:protein-L-isoaspartate O-methyltransferase [Dictyocaulus viviparus]